MKKLFLSVLILLLSSSWAYGKTLSNAQRIKKASYILNGQHLSSSNDTDFNSDQNFDETFELKIDEFINDDNFTSTIKEHVLNLFRMYVSEEGSNNMASGFMNNNAFDNLIEDVISNNRPWRDLLTANAYEASTVFTNAQLVGSDLLFFQTVFYQEVGPYLDNYVETRDAPFDVSGDPTETILLRPENTEQAQTLAGVITTQRFFNRYSTTKVNKNRGRSSTLFRIFLCDPMKPIVLTDDAEDRALLNRAFDDVAAHAGGSDTIIDDERRHGEDLACMACHYKLDPLAKTFSGSSFNLNPFAQPGQLVFQNSRNERVERDFIGFAGMAEAIVEQYDYKACQVEHFWDWIIGEDIPLDVETKQELTTKFIELDEKPQDFIKHLVKREEFYRYEPLQEEDITYSHVQPIFRKCDSCHHGQSWAPVLSEGYPFNDFWNQALGHSLAEEIIKDTDILNGTANRRMPPANAGWELRESERDLLAAWVKNGAKDDDGNIHVDSGDIFNQLQSHEYAEGFSSVLEPTFYPTFTRILVANVLLDTFRSKFNLSSDRCSVNETTRRNIGFPMAVNGRPLFKYLTPSYLQWWLRCLSQNEYGIDNFYNDNSIIPDSFSEEYAIDHEVVQQNTWTSLSMEQQRGLLLAVEYHILGRGILTSRQRERITQRIYENIEEQGSSMATFRAMGIAARTLLTTRAFLTY